MAVSRRVFLAMVVGVSIAPEARGHGASKGLHLHLEPDPAAPGTRITVELSAAAAIRRAEVGFPGQETVSNEPKSPGRKLSLRLKVPSDTREATLNCQAEVATVEGKTLRASAVLRVRLPEPPRPD